MSTTPRPIEILQVVIEVNADSLKGLSTTLDSVLGPIETRLLGFARSVTAYANKAAEAVTAAVLTAAVGIEEGVALIQGTLVAFGASLKTISDSSIAPFAMSLARIGTFVNAAQKHTAGSISKLIPDLQSFATSFGHVADSLASPNMVIASQNMGRIGFFANALGRVKFEKFVDSAYAVTSTVNDLSNALSVVTISDDALRAGTILGKLGTTLNAISKVPTEKLTTITTSVKNLFSAMAGYASDETMKASLALMRLGTSLKAIEKFNVDKIEKLTTPLATLFGSFKGLATDDALKAMSSLGRLSTSLSSIGKFKVENLTGLAEPIRRFFASLAGIATEDAIRVVQALGKLTSGMVAVGKVDAAKMAKTLSSLRMFMSGVAAIPVTAGTASVIASLNQLTSSMRNLSGVGGGIPPRIGGVSSSLAGIPPLASRASSSLNTLSGSVRGLAGSMMSLHGSMTYVRYPLAALMGFGVAAFAKFDDALTRTLAHMREWPELDTHITTRTVLERGVAEISSTSITGATELAKALDHLTSSGMDAANAVRGLVISERFAIAANMQAADATQRLVEMQRAMALSSTEPEKHFRNMTMLGDRFAGMAPMVGSSTKQFMEAFGEKFTTVMRQTGISLEEGIGIMGAYSIQGVKGAEASDRAARMIRQVGLQAITSGEQWRRMGVPVRDAHGEFRSVSDIIIDLTNSLEGMSNAQATARLSLMGLQDRSLAAVMTLRGMGPTMKELQKQAGDTDGVMAKMAAMLRADFFGQMKILWNNISNVARAFGSFLAPAIGAVATAIESLTKGFRDLNPAYQRLIMISGIAYLTIGVLGPVFRALGSVIAFVLTPIRVLASSFLMIGSFAISTVVGIANLTVSFFRLGRAIYNAAASMVGFIAVQSGKIFSFFAGITARLVMDINALGRVLPSIFGSLLTFLAGGFASFSALLVHGIFSTINFIAGLGSTFASIGQSLAKAFVSGFATISAGVVKLMVSLVVGLVNLTLTLGTWFLVITAGLALVATLGGVVITAFKMVAVSIGSMWEGIKSGTSAFFENLNDRAIVAGDILVRMWSRAKEVTPAYFDSVMGYVSKLAGFFWNFAFNVSSIWEWLTTNWRTITVDMGNAFATAVENMARNIKEFFKFLIEAGKIAWDLLFSLVQIYGRTGFLAIKMLWSALLGDMETAFKGFGNRFIDIWGQVMSTVATGSIVAIGMIAKGAIDATARRLEEASLARRMDVASQGVVVANETLRGERFTLRSRDFWEKETKRREAELRGIQAEAREFEEAPKRAIRNLFKPTPVEEGGSRLIRSLRDLPGFADYAARESRTPVATAGTQFERLFSKTFGEGNKFKSLLEGFEAVTDTIPVLNLMLPPDWTKQIGKKLGAFGPKPGEPMDTEAAASKQHPGYTFKQISLERTMLGGPGAESLDYQQLVVMRNMDKNLALLRAAAEDRKYRSDAREVITHMYGAELATEVLGE